MSAECLSPSISILHSTHISSEQAGFIGLLSLSPLWRRWSSVTGLIPL